MSWACACLFCWRRFVRIDATLSPVDDSRGLDCHGYGHYEYRPMLLPVNVPTRVLILQRLHNCSTSNYDGTSSKLRWHIAKLTVDVEWEKAAGVVAQLREVAAAVACVKLGTVAATGVETQVSRPVACCLTISRHLNLSFNFACVRGRFWSQMTRYKFDSFGLCGTYTSTKWCSVHPLLNVPTHKYWIQCNVSN